MDTSTLEFKTLKEILDVYYSVTLNDSGGQDLTRACITYLRGYNLPDIVEIWKNENGKHVRYATYRVTRGIAV